MEDVRGEVTRAWAAHRAYLIDLAFRMLGDIGDAEDIVVEAFSRLARADRVSIREERGWLTVVTSRLCLDRLRSARSRRERPHDFGAGTPAGAAALSSTEPDPADRATLDDSIRFALLLMMRALSPAERVVFVLHDVFQLPFEEIAETVGRPAATCRQVMRRARQKIGADGGGRRLDVTADEHRALTERFLGACATGDIAALLAVLDPDVSGDVDLGPEVPAPGISRGAQVVGGNILSFWGGATLVSLPADGPPVLLAFRRGEIAGVLGLTPTVDGERVAKVHVTADPAKLARIRHRLAGTGS
jgi:RNA polymerase sigma-70 factor, ECF subfamily